MKRIRATMPDGTVWDIPAAVVAEHRATYYAQRDPDTTYSAEYDLTMRDDYELLDWAGNNMDWEDVEARAVRVDTPQPGADRHKQWLEAEREVVR